MHATAMLLVDAIAAITVDAVAFDGGELRKGGFAEVVRGGVAIPGPDDPCMGLTSDQSNVIHLPI